MLRTLVSFRDPWEAHMLRGRLASEGIPAWIAHELHIANNWSVSTALGGARVQVPLSCLPEAEDVWAKCYTGAYLAEMTAEFGDIGERRCPVCGATDIRRRPSPGELLFGLIMAFGFGIGAKVVAARCTCGRCGHRWRDKD